VVIEPFNVAPVLVTEVAATVVASGAHGLEAVGQLAPSLGELGVFADATWDAVIVVADPCISAAVTEISSAVLLSKK
jgi:hypothetical protein